ncbi:MAG: hypothetical protein PXX73_00080 [Sideroxydans sp.]|nr:hypothetical protein [Sideroxydans sp.]
MKIHNYSPTTGEYLNTTTADESPLEPGTFMIPALATGMALPAVKANEVAVFATGAWSVVADYRGQTVYEKTTGVPVQITELGALPASLVITKPTPTPAQIAAQFSANQTAALTAVDTFHANTVQQLAGNPTQVEKDSWAMKLTTANAVIAKATVSAEGIAFMTALGLIAPAGATAAQVSAADTAKATWATKVQANAAKFAGLVGLADSLRTSAKAALTAATDQASLDAAQAANKAAALAAIAALPKV